MTPAERQRRYQARKRGEPVPKVRPGIKSSNSSHPLYVVWVNMKQRCSNPRNPRFPRYGGRGIRVCERWLRSFVAFASDMGPKPTPDHSLDRINNNSDYGPSNCRWATALEQRMNTEPRVLCKRGHELNNMNAYTKKNGARDCRLCRRERSSALKAKLVP